MDCLRISAPVSFGALHLGRALHPFLLSHPGIQSSRTPKETMDRVEAILKQKGMTIFARVDHAAGAAKIGTQLRPTELLIFGNPQGGTPLIECSQTVCIDLPLKVLVWRDESGQVWIGFNDLTYIAQRHDASDCAAAAKLGKVIASLVAAAAEPDPAIQPR